MNPRQASLRSSHRSAAPVHSKRPASDDDTTSKKSRTSKKSKKSSSVAANKPDIFPSYELLTKLSDPETYQRALLVKQEQKRELVDLDQLLTATAYGTSGDQRADPKDRLLSVLRWKLLRGQFRPTLPALVAQKSSEEVIRRVDKALDLLANCQTVDQAIQSDATKTMCELRGVGPATAAAFLSFEAPNLIPVFSDEAASFFESSLGPIKYTLPYYKRYVECMQASLADLVSRDDGWNLNRLEKALWSFRVLHKFLPDQEWRQLIDVTHLSPQKASTSTDNNKTLNQSENC
ncbi:hypothetical protein PCANC_14921 [Puccinia coronata f. sp. avenae]|uniref:Uncharacterized protein n=1 Tax=Puccinia coronata f. sp. avenae TaxID=200324 RepID=A0A2N5TUJ2_9BASI|nr:hypothetical protein PCANC_14921 [Puccinia coronata f. sp. avenae]PLW29176.1 hypothetical protein PCASD_10939 [Puccinia coronata f. sp. avenae]